MLTSTESIGTPGKSAKEQMYMQIQLQQQQPVHHTTIFVEGDGPEPVPKLKEPTCCCGCGIGTASIIAMIIHALITWNIFAKLGESEKRNEEYFYVPLIFYGGMTLCYAGIAFFRTEQLCSIVSAVNHIFSIPMYLAALGLFLLSAYALLYSGAEVSEKPEVTELDKEANEMIKSAAVQIPLYIGVFCTIMGCFYTYMAIKYQEFGEYLNKENKQ